MLVFLIAAALALVAGVFRFGPTDPQAIVAVVVGLLGAAGALQAALAFAERKRLRERYRQGVQQYGREFGETEFFRALVAASGRGLASEDRPFQRPAGFARDDAMDTGDLTDRRRWAKEAELLRIVGTAEDAPGRYVTGLTLCFIVALWMSYRFATQTPPYVETPVAAATAQMAQPVTPPTVGPPEFVVKEAAPPKENHVPKARWILDRCGVILDDETGKRWHVGPDKTFKRDDALWYVSGLKACGRRWRLPTPAELKALFDPNLAAGTGYESNGIRYPARISPMFDDIGRGTWVWADTPAYGDPNAFNLNTGQPVMLNEDPGDYTVRVLAVTP